MIGISQQTLEARESVAVTPNLSVDGLKPAGLAAWPNEDAARAAATMKAPLLGTIRNYAVGDFDFLVAVVFEQNWDVRCAAKIAHADLEEFLDFREHVNGHNMRLAPSVFTDKRVKNITNALRD